MKSNIKHASRKGIMKIREVSQDQVHDEDYA